MTLLSGCVSPTTPPKVVAPVLFTTKPYAVVLSNESTVPPKVTAPEPAPNVVSANKVKAEVPKFIAALLVFNVPATRTDVDPFTLTPPVKVSVLVPAPAPNCKLPVLPKLVAPPTLNVPPVSAKS